MLVRVAQDGDQAAAPTREEVAVAGDAPVDARVDSGVDSPGDVPGDVTVEAPEAPFRPVPERHRQRVDRIRIRPLLRVSVLAFVVVLTSLIVAGIAAWWIARTVGSLGALEAFIAEAFALDAYVLPSGLILAGWGAFAAFASLICALMLTLVAVAYNRVAQLVGGIEVETTGVRTASAHHRR